MQWKLWAYRDIRIFICMYLHKGYAWDLGKKTVPHIRIILGGLGVVGSEHAEEAVGLQGHIFICMYIHKGYAWGLGKKTLPQIRSTISWRLYWGLHWGYLSL